MLASNQTGTRRRPATPPCALTYRMTASVSVRMSPELASAAPSAWFPAAHDEQYVAAMLMVVAVTPGPSPEVAVPRSRVDRPSTPGRGPGTDPAVEPGTSPSVVTPADTGAAPGFEPAAGVE